MKKIYIIAGLLFLASCGQADIQETSSVATPVTDTVVVEQNAIPTSEEPPVPAEGEDDQTKSEDLIKPEDENPITDDDQTKDEDLVKPEDETPVEEVPVEDTPAEEINDEVAALDVAAPDLSKTVTLDAPYNNPKWLVDMKLNYSLDSDGKIESIAVSATTYKGLGDFNDEIQSLIGSSLEEAAEYKSGSSLTAPAFKAAIKSQL